MNRLLASSIIALACCGVVRAQSTQPTTPPPTDVPVAAIKLFSSGVGYFERDGVVSGEDHTTLKFKTDQINDILKSLVLQDLDGGSPGVISYPSEDPVGRTLAGFSINLSQNSSLLDLLTQLRGSQLTLSFGPEKITGTLLSTEKKQRLVGDGKQPPIPIAVLNVLAGTQIRAIPLDDVRDVQLDDPQLQSDLTHALAILAGSRDQNQKPVEIAFHGKGQRHVRIGYVVESPVWKTSYRLVLNDQNGDEKGGDKPHIQGWAMVENQTDSDWINVQLSLISGRPISFIENLYSPIYLTRPTVQPNLYGGLQPPLADIGGVLTASAGEASPPAAPAMAKPKMAKMMARTFRVQDLNGEVNTAIDPLSSIVEMASTASLGELFSYTIDNVTLRRHQSAMLPIVTDSIEAQRLSIFNQQTLATHPLNGVRLKNTTDKHLLQGPITVFDKSSYAGDAQIDNLPPGQSRLLGYGIDLQMTINATKESNDVSIQSASISKGVLTVSRRTLSKHEFKIDNQSDAARTLVIEDPLRPGWTITGPAKPIETTADQNRFQLDVAAKQTTTFTVEQQIDNGEAVEILSCDEPTLTLYTTTGTIAKPVRDALAKAAALKAAVVATQEQISAREATLKSITSEQTRMRANMEAIDHKADYYTRLMTKLNDQENQIEKLQADNVEAEKQLNQQKAALNDYVANLTVE